MAYIYIRCDGQTAIRRRGKGDIWQGLWELVDKDELSVPAEPLLVKKNFRHVLTHRVLLCDFYLWEPSRKPQLPQGYVWIPEDQIDRYALPRMIQLLIEMLPVRR